MSIQSLASKGHTYTDATGTYQIDKLFPFINAHPDKHQLLPIKLFLDNVIHDTWGNFQELKASNFKKVFDDQGRQRQIKQVDLKHPLIVTNFNRLIDGVHRLFKAIFYKHPHIRVVFIDRSELRSVRVGPKPVTVASEVEGLPIADIHLQLPKGSLPPAKEARAAMIEDYFPDHLPTATPNDQGFSVCLERPSSPYGCLEHDPQIRTGLQWWHKGTRVRDVCAAYRLFSDGLLALEEQWVPLSWSNTFQRLGHIPSEVVLLHLDDHQDMMPPRIGKRLDGKLVDYVTGDHIDFLKPKTVQSAIESGAIGKGSILTPLIWQVDKIHVRHLTFRPHPGSLYKIDKVMLKDQLLFPEGNRIGLHFSDTSPANLQQQSNYVVTPHIDKWLANLPKGVPILLHFDLDYFNNRFDGNSGWHTDPSARSFNPRFSQQKQQLQRVMKGIQLKKLANDIVDTTIGISPGFFPAEHWKPMVNDVKKELVMLGIHLTGDISMKTRSMRRAEELAQQAPVPAQKADEPQARQIKKIAKQALAQKQIRPKPEGREKRKKTQPSTQLKRGKLKEPKQKAPVPAPVTVVKMASKAFEGWRVKLDGASCGFVKFIPKVDQVFHNHVTVDFAIPKPHRGKHIGRRALKKAVDASVHTFFVAHLRKSNTASKKALAAVGFEVYEYPGSKQLCMTMTK